MTQTVYQDDMLLQKELFYSLITILKAADKDVICGYCSLSGRISKFLFEFKRNKCKQFMLNKTK